jgi:hypothetical protein
MRRRSIETGAPNRRIANGTQDVGSATMVVRGGSLDLGNGALADDNDARAGRGAGKGSLRQASPALDRGHRTLLSAIRPLEFQKR